MAIPLESISLETLKQWKKKEYVFLILFFCLCWYVMKYAICHSHQFYQFTLVFLPSVTAGPFLPCRRALVSSDLENYLKLVEEPGIRWNITIIWETDYFKDL